MANPATRVNLETNWPPDIGKVNMLQDSYGRTFRYLRLSITDVCNFSCDYCLPDGYQRCHQEKFLSLDEINCVARSFAELGVEKIRITGGEPSLRKDLPQIIRAIKSTSGIKKVALTTNGYKLSQQLPQWIANGLDSLNVSIDSFEPDQFQLITGHNKLQEILNGIDQALLQGFTQIKINTVLMKQYNAGQLQQYFDYIKHRPVSLRFIELMQTGDNKAFYDAQHVSGQHIKNQLFAQGWSQVKQDKTAGPAQVFSHPDYRGTIGLIMPYSKDFCSTCNRLRVSSLGKMHLCLFAEQGLSLKPFLQNNDSKGLKAFVNEQLASKEATHYLTQGFSGATKHLSMLGG